MRAMLKRLRITTLIALLVGAGLTGAVGAAQAETTPLDDARALFAAGNWVEAAAMAEAEGSGEGLALATQVTSYYGRFLAPKAEREALFARAMEMAEQAIQLAPENAFAHLQSAHAMGRFSQTVGILKAISEGFAGRIREAVEKAIALDPDYAAAYMLLANWHAEIINNAGFMGRMVYGADEDEALAHYEKAVALAPNDLMIRLEYASGLMKLDEDNTDAARAQLEALLAHAPQTALEGLIHDRAAAMLAALNAGDDAYQADKR